MQTSNEKQSLLQIEIRPLSIDQIKEVKGGKDPQGNDVVIIDIITP